MSRDKNAVQSTTAKQAEQSKPKGFLSGLVGQAAATGIDVLTGSNPVGMVGNALSLAFTGRTIGGNVVNAVQSGTNTYSPGDQSQRLGGGDDSASRRKDLMKDTTEKETKKKAEAATTSTAADSSNSFEDKYLNDSGRPTPEQKWDWNSPKYLGVA